MDRPRLELGTSPVRKGRSTIELPAQRTRSWARTSAHRYVRPALFQLSYPRMRAPEGNRTPVPSLEDWCLGPLGHWSIAICHPPSESRTPLSGLRAQCITRQCLRGLCTAVRPGGIEPPCSRVSDGRLTQPQLRAVDNRWGGLEPPPRGPHPRALPAELRTWVESRRLSAIGRQRYLTSTAGGS